MVSGPFPRQYEIVFTQHLRDRSAQRDVTVEAVTLAIQTGSQRPQPGRGGRGGVFVEFSKRIGERSIIVIAEIVGNQCFVLTTYAK